MTPGRKLPLAVSFEPAALERCFLVAEILAEDFDRPLLEYALVGVSRPMHPLHVVATLLLPGQHVTSATVHGAGHGVLLLRREMHLLACRTRQRLVPIIFVHRHPGSCSASATDLAFLGSVFIDQVSTVVSFRGLPRADGAVAPCECDCVDRSEADGFRASETYGTWEAGCGLAFSLIVNRQREHSIYAVRKDTCTRCGASKVSEVPARLALPPDDPVGTIDLAMERQVLKREVEAKLDLSPGNEKRHGSDEGEPEH